MMDTKTGIAILWAIMVTLQLLIGIILAIKIDEVREAIDALKEKKDE